MGLPSFLRRWSATWHDLRPGGVRFLPAIAAGGFALAVLLVAVAASLNDRYGASIQDSFIATGQQRETLTDLLDLDNALDEATSGARAFLLSGNRDHLIPYTAAAAASRSLLDKMSDGPGVAGSTDAIVAQARAYLGSLESIVASIEAGQRQAALAEAGPDLGRAANAALQAGINTQREQLTRSVLERRTSILRELQEARRFNLLAAFSVASVLLAFGALLRHYIKRNADASRALAAANASLGDTIRRRTAELTELSQHLLSVREEERAELARDIHDQIGSELAALRMDCARLESAGTGHNPLAQSTWPRIKVALNDLTLAHRRIINSLHPTVLDHLGLEAAIRGLLRERLTNAPVAFQLTVQGGMDGLPPPVAIAAYRVVQEAISNVLKHANGKHIAIMLRRRASMLTVHVIDDGVGIGAERSDKGRLGLVGMRERAHKLGGSFHVGAGPGNVGTRVTARFRVGAAGGEMHAATQTSRM